MAGVLVLAIFLLEELILGVLVSMVHLLKVLVPKVSVSEVLVPLSAWKCTCNLFESWN